MDPSFAYKVAQGVIICFRGRLYIGADLAVQKRVIQALHGSPIGGHSGIHGTYVRLKQLFFWPGMKKGVETFVRECDTCQRIKAEHVLSLGLLQPLQIPETPWSHISMDFVEGLPVSRSKDTIFVVIDRLTKYAHFLPISHPFTAASVAQVLMVNVFKLHGLPRSIVSKRDKKF